MKIIKNVLLTVLVIVLLFVIAVLIVCAVKGMTFTEVVKGWYEAVKGFFDFSRFLKENIDAVEPAAKIIL